MAACQRPTDGRRDRGGPTEEDRTLCGFQEFANRLAGGDGQPGVRTVRRTDARDGRGSGAEHEFSFMGAGVSSERRVEILVDQISWEMRRIREQGGKIVVVAGPVVVHTGGAEHLAWLVREGYVQALLGGNAIAVHDIEQALLGTSLGVDLKLGTSVEGGHRHHLQAINTICGCGGIARAVEQGILKSGIFYECVRRRVPFSLAGRFAMTARCRTRKWT